MATASIPAPAATANAIKGRPPAGPESRIRSMRRMKQLALHEADNCLEVVWGDGARAVFHGFWLRDNAAAYFDPQTGQRTRNTLALTADAYVLAAAEHATGSAAVRVAFRDGFSTAFTSAWLRQHGHETRQQFRVRPRLWANDLYGAFPGRVLPTVAWSDVVTLAPAAPGSKAGSSSSSSSSSSAAWQRSGRGFAEWITALRDFGVVLMEGVPPVPDAAKRLADMVSYHRKTHYGDTFQVKSEAKPSHLAYTPVELEVHTDLNYRESSPGIQLLHCLVSDADGGESTFVDGFMVADCLLRESPEDFRTLCQTAIPFRVKDGDGYHYFKIPTVCLSDAGELVEVHYNERTRAPLELPAAEVGRVYRALARFQEIALRPENCVEVKMKAGDCVAFNNRRILHGRKAFDPRTGRRHLVGCYIDFDEFATCLRKHGITPPPVARAGVHGLPLPSGPLSSSGVALASPFGSLNKHRGEAVAAAAAQASGLRAAL